MSHGIWDTILKYTELYASVSTAEATKSTAHELRMLREQQLHLHNMQNETYARNFISKNQHGRVPPKTIQVSESHKESRIERLKSFAITALVLIVCTLTLESLLFFVSLKFGITANVILAVLIGAYILMIKNKKTAVKKMAYQKKSTYEIGSQEAKKNHLSGSIAKKDTKSTLPKTDAVKQDAKATSPKTDDDYQEELHCLSINNFRSENPFILINILPQYQKTFISECKWFEEKTGRLPSKADQLQIIQEIRLDDNFKESREFSKNMRA